MNPKKAHGLEKKFSNSLVCLLKNLKKKDKKLVVLFLRHNPQHGMASIGIGPLGLGLSKQN